MKKIILITLQLGLCFFVPAQTLLKDINPGTGYSNPRNFVALGNLTLFIASDNLHGYELWKTDGTTLGTSLVMDINPGVADGLFFLDNIISIYNFTPLVLMGSKVYFFATDGSSGYELWSSDGTTSGTAIVKDINPGSGDAVYQLYTSIIVKGSELYFRADDGTNGAELWKSDGTALGTMMVKNINPSGVSYPDNLYSDGNLIYFNANDGTNGNELWISDGTTLGTTLLADINSGSNGSSAQEFTKFNNKIYFIADNGVTGYELWVTDGTTAGTQLLKDINPGINGSSPLDFIVYNNHLFFSAYDATNGAELWYSDGTASGTLLLKNIFPGSASGNPYLFTLFNGKIFFQANDGTKGAELWSTDGTTLGTSLFLDINNVSDQSSSPYYLTVANGSLYFNASDGTNGYELWKTDGTVSGTAMLNQICPGSCDGFPSFIIQNGNTLYFNGTEPNTGTELYKLDLPTTGINELSENNLKVYPNPFSSQLQVKGTGANGELVLYDLFGKDILRQKTYSSETKINTENLLPGIYLLSYLNGNKTINIKITNF